ncbi:class I SAM-dependent methyltransferase [Blastococcus sp. URHD0036]|uniref:class I SAM-dependent methyltransferase n=1 Tax=Blastococcus sp. URHD0036 TaxID=1380356 RepID=UPI000495E92F|nr:methyltransferase domain-containing protein [Blastococcus sp. URHD0036]
MAEAGAGAYARILGRLLDAGVIQRSDRVFVQFAGEFDQAVAADLGLEDVVFANLEPDSPSSRLSGGLTTDAHAVDLPDGSFDHVFAHAGLHHCSRPHQALYEMYRLARKTVVAVENQDSPLMRLACRLGLAGVYEHDAVRDGGGVTGGVDGTAVPNHVYRWTRREVVKTVASFDPAHAVPVEFTSAWLIGSDRALTPSMRGLLSGRRAAVPLLNAALNGLARRQGNIFGFVVRKDLAVEQPWITSPATTLGSSS